MGNQCGADQSVLPDFPVLKDELAKRLHDALDRMVDAKAPIFTKMQTRAQHEGKLHTYDRVGASTKSEGPEWMAIPVKVELAEVPELVGDKLTARLDALATEIAQQKMDLFHRRFKESAEEVGNAFDAKGAPLTQDMFLSMLEGVDMEFGANAQPTADFGSTNPKIDAKVREWFNDPSFQSRYNSIVDRKRDEWRDRESHRKLVD
jgi:hypothetical protein